MATKKSKKTPAKKSVRRVKKRTKRTYFERKVRELRSLFREDKNTMRMHDGTSDFLKIVAVMGFIILAVSWIEGQVGGLYTVIGVGILIILAFILVIALILHMNQKMTLDAITRFNADDARIDAARMGSFRALASGDAAMQRAAAQITVLDAKRVDRLADQRAKLLTDVEREQWHLEQRRRQQADNAWGFDDDSDDDGTYQEWR